MREEQMVSASSSSIFGPSPTLETMGVRERTTERVEGEPVGEISSLIENLSNQTEIIKKEISGIVRRTAPVSYKTLEEGREDIELQSSTEIGMALERLRNSLAESINDLKALNKSINI